MVLKSVFEIYVCAKLSSFIFYGAVTCLASDVIIDWQRVMRTGRIMALQRQGSMRTHAQIAKTLGSMSIRYPRVFISGWYHASDELNTGLVRNLAI